MDAYVEALCRDLEKRSSECKDYRVDTVYFGGGTPTLLPPSLLLRILDHIVGLYRVDGNVEISAECNPKTVTKEDLSALRRGGFNRLSLGLQSTHESELKALGRIHTFREFEATFFDAREAGFANVSVDLMFGIPEQTPQSYGETLRTVCALSPEHISAYGLIIEEGTPFYQMQSRLALPDEESTRQMYLESIEALENAGYLQYEISNFARKGYESRHNLKYWCQEEYLGFGPAAYSDFKGARFGNSRDLSAYIEGRDVLAEREDPSAAERINEYVMLRMRLADGVSEKDFLQKFGISFEKTFGERLLKYQSYGLLRQTEKGWAFTREGFYVSNTVLSELLDFSN